MVQQDVAGSDSDDDRIAVTLRQMALVDRVLGLEAEVARLNATAPGANGARDEISRLEAELRAVYASRTWKVGLAVTKVAQPLRRLRGR